MTLRVYIAGPDVFRADAGAWADEVRALCAAHGCEALVPLDGAHATPEAIYTSNVELIRRADAVLANLNPFRGAEPDSGTCFEVGFAVALGKRVVGYMASGESIAARVTRMQGSASGAGPIDAQGMHVENFGLPLNLMLAVPANIVIGDIRDALRALMGARNP
ncbi:nucleoside 2-deoxyribosyltransferase [Uliginosibacterium sp. sgz301328]|uniref:nucleoside 2-deoxyribosyltransferase n=1 Tax=Uliginosibacterium sp. sgz301328 TaxID=3243764 RepID=UPI00359E09A0